jgi:hypothetical protein
MKDKTKGYIILSAISLCIIIIVYLVNEGTPTGKHKFKKELSLYINERFTQNIVVDNINYSFKLGIYWAMVSPEDNSKLKFQISQSTIGDGLWDDYIQATWLNEVDRELGEYVKNIYSPNSKGTIYLGDIIPVIEAYTTIPYGNIPSYHDVKQELGQGSKILININRGFLIDNQDEENDKIYKVTQYIKEKDFTFNLISFNYDCEKNSTNCTRIRFDTLGNVNSKDDVAKIVQESL